MKPGIAWELERILGNFLGCSISRSLLNARKVPGNFREFSEEKVYFTNFRKFVDVNLDRLQDSILRKSLGLSTCALNEKILFLNFTRPVRRTT